MTTPKLPEINWKYVILIAVIVLVVVFWDDIKNLFSSILGGAQSILNPLGNSANTAEINAANVAIAAQDQAIATQTTTSPWGPSLYTNATGDTTLSDDAATTLAKQIYSSWGEISSNGQTAFSAIQQCECQADVSHVALMYQNNYSSSMYDDMSNHYDSSSNKEILAQMIAYVNALPLYYNG
jgi:hypothetical protein